MKKNENMAFLELQKQKGRPSCMIGKHFIVSKVEEKTEA